MSVAPIIPTQESASAGSAKPSARPKRINPPSHWHHAAPVVATPKKPTPKAALPTVTATPATAEKPRLSPWAFGTLLLLGAVLLNALLLWLFPLPPLQGLRPQAPVFSPAPTAEDSELPVWLRS